MSAKEKILKFLSKDGPYNTLTSAQARARFGIVNVGARIEELRAEGYCIYTNKTYENSNRSVFCFNIIISGR